MSVLTHSTTSKTNWDFDPRSIPDCDIWFDAADSTTHVMSGSTTTVKAWKNKGYIDMFAIETTVGANGAVTRGSSVNGNTFLNFPAGTDFSFTCAISSSTSRSWFIAMRATTQINTSVSPQYIGPINATASTQDAVVIARSSNTGYTPYESPNANATNMIQSNLAPNPFDTPLVLTMIHSTVAANNRIAVNGTRYTANVVNGVAAGYSTASLQYKINTASYNTGIELYEILHYNREVSTIERSAIEGYLMWKWGIKRQNESGFVPTSISGCLAWFDSDVDYNDATSRATSFTFSSGDSVNVWKDKTGNGRDATFLSSGSSSIRPVLTFNQVAGKPAVLFSGASALSSPLTLSTTQPITVFLVAASNSLSAFRAALSLNAYPGTRRNLLTIYQSSGNTWWFSGGDASTDGNTASIAVVSNRYDILANYWNSTLRTQMNINGHYIPSSTSSPSSLTANSTMLIGSTTSAAAPSTVIAELWSGGIAEIIIYNSVLSRDQRNQVERYLSLKWNRPLVNACAIVHPNKWVPDFARTFVPTDISGCRIWLDASDSSTITLSGSNVSQWRDKTGNGRHMTGRSTFGTATVSTAFQNGLNVLNCSGQTIYEAPAGSAVYPLDCYIVVAIKTLPSRNDVFSITAPTGTDNFNSLTFGEHTSLRWHNGSTNFNRTPATVSPTNETSTGFLLMNWSLANGNYVIRRNGTQLSQTALYTFTLTANSVFQIGFRQFGSPPDVSLNAYIAEIIVYDSQLDAGNRQRIEGYLSSKWNLRANLPLTHPGYYASAVTDIVNFTPTVLSDCRLWLDASDTSTINGGAFINDGTLAAEWKDKINNLVLTTDRSPTWGYTLGKLPAVNVSTGGFRGVLPSPLTNYRQTTFIVATLTSYPVDTDSVMFYASGTPPAAYIEALRIVDHVATGTLFRSVGFFGGSTYIASTARAALNTPFMWTVTYTGTTPLNVFRNSGELTGTVATPSAATLNGSFFGISSDPNGRPGVNLWPGSISEIITYGRVLTTTERIRVETYLARKWNITQSILAANRFVTPGAIPDSPRIFPTTFLDIALWLDGADPDADGIQPASGTKISKWIDKSGNEKTCVQLTLAERPTFSFDGIYPAIQFNSANSENLRGVTLMTSTNYGIFVASRYTGPTGVVSRAVSFFTRKVITTDAENFISMYDYFNAGGGNARVTDIYYSYKASGVGTTYKSGVSTSIGLNDRAITTISDNSAAPASGQQVIFMNGSVAPYQFLNNSTANVATDASGYSIGRSQISSVNANYYTGFVYEVIIMLHTPTTQEREMIEGYLAWKWGVNPSLPTVHSYKLTNP